MKHSASRGRQLKRLACLSTAAVLIGLLTAPSSGVAQAPALDPGTPPGVDEIASTPNLKQVAYLPKTGPFANSTNSDWAFQGDYAYGGNYNGFTVYDISKPKAPTVAAQVLCPGSQNDVSVKGNLLFLGTDSQRTNDSCDNAASTTAVPGDRWEGIKIFDISDPLTPRTSSRSRPTAARTPRRWCRASVATSRSTCTSRRTTCRRTCRTARCRTTRSRSSGAAA
jgi:hypothetical protein